MAEVVEPFAVATVILPGLDVTIYFVIGLPPLLAGAVQLTLTWLLPGVAVTAVGAPGGTAMGVTEVDADELRLVPAEFVAVTVNV